MDDTFFIADQPSVPEPAVLLPLRFSVGGSEVYGSYLRAAGSQFGPTVLLLHGFPGYEKNTDLAHLYRRAGIHVLCFHYRGAWGSRGQFSFTNVLEDVAAAIDLLASPSGRDQFRCDPRQIALVGHSMGGFASLIAAARHPGVLGAAALAPFNFGAFGKQLRANAATREATVCSYAENILPLRGTTPAGLVDELVSHAEEWDLTALAPALAIKNLLLVAGTNDVVSKIEVHHEPIATAIRLAGATQLREIVLDDDHTFSTLRLTLGRVTLRWLQELFSR